MIAPATRLHKLVEVVDEPLPETTHHYVIARDLLAALTREDVTRSVQALLEVGMARLPFPRLLVEFDLQPGVVRFAWLEESAGAIDVRMAVLSPTAAMVAREPMRVAPGPAGFDVKGADSETDGHAAIVTVFIAMLMLNIRGIEREVIEPTRLNRARVKAGKGAVPRHVLVKIGVVYGRDGKPVGSGNALKRVFLRAGHVRQQACGERWQDRRPVYIEPTLVNFEPGDAAPAPVKRVVALGARADNRGVLPRSGEMR